MKNENGELLGRFGEISGSILGNDWIAEVNSNGNGMCWLRQDRASGRF